MGRVLIGLLTSQAPVFDKIWIVSAFAKEKGVRHLTQHIIQAKSQGADIRVVIGIDHKSTSVEALREINSLGVNAKIVDNIRPNHTFHPKIYLFEATGIKAELLVGSSNLTEGGLFSNYEASTRTTFELPSDEADYNAIKQSLERYLNPAGKTVQILTNELIQTLRARKDIPTEKEMTSARKRAKSSGKKRHEGIPASPFGSESLRYPPKLPKLLKPKAAKRKLTQKPYAPSAGKAKPSTHGTLLWQKSKLPASDVQRQIGNVTGGLRLTQARWKANGENIDQTTYFRTAVFGGLQWDKWKDKPYSEIATAKFAVQILGKDYGLHELDISHKPSGEAGQHNYTTILHWGALSDIVRKLNLIGKTFRLYAPPEGQTEPFFIEVI